MEADSSRVDIDLDLDEPVGRRARTRRSRRSWWVLAGLGALVVGLPGSATTTPVRPVPVDPLPSAQVTSGALRDQYVPELPPGDVSGDSSWCVFGQRDGHAVIVPCGAAHPR
jgi:hypothetical protein